MAAAWLGSVIGVQESVDERINERLPRSLDDVFAHPDGGPLASSVGRVEQHSGNGARALPRIENPHLEVGQADARQRRVGVTQRGTNGSIERVHGAIAFPHGEMACLLDPELDRR